MITYQKAQQIVQAIVRTVETEIVPLPKATNRILAANAVSDIAMPPFDKSAMDGYACRRKDIAMPLTVTETISAGTVPNHTITKGTCAKIMTGAPIPSGADCVFLIEHSQLDSDGRVSCLRIPEKNNICKKGEDSVIGQNLITQGQVLQPEHIPILAAIGMVAVPVIKMPTVGLFASGSEIIDASLQPTGAQIRDSNRPMIKGLLASLGIDATDYGIVPDNEEALRHVVEKSAKENDITICTGGVSMGDFDLMPQIVNSCGFELLIADLSIQPGKPVKVFQRNSHVLFALSGNPVSSYIQFQLLAKPFLYYTEISAPSDCKIQTTLPFTYTRKKAGRTGFVPVRIGQDGTIELIDFHGSAHIFAFAQANALLEIPADCSTIQSGEYATIRII